MYSLASPAQILHGWNTYLKWACKLRVYISTFWWPLRLRAFGSSVLHDPFHSIKNYLSKRPSDLKQHGSSVRKRQFESNICWIDASWYDIAWICGWFVLFEYWQIWIGAQGSLSKPFKSAELCVYTFRDSFASINAVRWAEHMAFGTNTQDIPLASGQKYQMVNAVMRVSLC